MHNLKEEILEILDSEFAYQDTDSTAWFELQHELVQRGMTPELKDVVRTLSGLESEGYVALSPTLFHGTIAGFTVRLTTAGHNQINYGRSSLVR
jgi:hypothetical protein